VTVAVDLVALANVAYFGFVVTLYSRDSDLDMMILI
jgi:hypothetical protein